MTVEGVPNEEIVQEHDVPIIDIIRHGETRYKEWNRLWKMDTHSPGFTLDSEHLDLTDEGIETIRKTIRQLATHIDKDHEIVLLLSSRAQRAYSSLLVAADEFAKLGIQMVRETSDPKSSAAIATNEDVFNKIIDTWFDEEGMPLVSRQKARTTTDGYSTYKKIIADKKSYKTGGDMGIPAVPAVFETIDKNFQRFLRHMNNIYEWFKPETLKVLEGKRLRIVCFSHVEVPQDFLTSVFDFSNRGILTRGQIVEIVPESQLKSGKDVSTKVTLYPIPHGRSRRPIEEGEAVVRRGYRPLEGTPDSVLRAQEAIAYEQTGYPYEDISPELSHGSVYGSIYDIRKTNEQLAQLVSEGAITEDEKKDFFSFFNQRADADMERVEEPLLKLLKRHGPEKEFALAYFKHNLNTVFNNEKRSDVLAKEAIHAVIADHRNEDDQIMFWTFAPYLFEELKGRGLNEGRAMRLILTWARTGRGYKSSEKEKKGKTSFGVNLKGLEEFKAYILAESKDDISHIFTKQEARRVADMFLPRKKIVKK